MNSSLNNSLRVLCLVSFLTLTLLGIASAQSPQSNYHVTSTTFQNGQRLPQVMIENIIQNGVNICTPDGSPGGNQSPELSWTGAKPGTASFAVVLYDVTAAFTHWGMYNISAQTSELPQDAGVPGSQDGPQVVNDFFFGAEYDGPCPPSTVKPFTHKYVFTVYDLDVVLHLPSSKNFPATGETLYQALIKAGRQGHILASARISGTFSTVQ
jgi:Raf kinase inhibitor-like YbhB/YbcL family protein